MPTLTANGITMNYQQVRSERRSGPPPPTVVFIHGLGTDSLASFYLTLVAPVSSVGIDIIAYDLRGHGRSDSPPTNYTLADYTDDLDALLDALEVEGPVHLVGNSFGGTLAYEYALVHPERVASIVSIEAEPATVAWAEKMKRSLASVVEDLNKADTIAWIAMTYGNHHARLARMAGKRMAASTIAVDIPKGPLVDIDDLQRIRCPVLTILGDEGYQADDPYLMESLLPNCRTVIVSDQDHSVLVESHRIVRQLLVSWVAEHHAPGFIPGLITVGAR